MPVVMLDSLVQTVLGQVVDVPVVVQRQVRGLSVQTAVLVPQLPFFAGRLPVMVQRPIPMVFLVRKTIESPQLQYVSWWSMSLFAGRADHSLLSV